MKSNNVDCCTHLRYSSLKIREKKKRTTRNDSENRSDDRNTVHPYWNQLPCCSTCSHWVLRNQLETVQGNVIHILPQFFPVTAITVLSLSLRCVNKWKPEYLSKNFVLIPREWKHPHDLCMILRIFASCIYQRNSQLPFPMLYHWVSFQISLHLVNSTYLFSEESNWKTMKAMVKFAIVCIEIRIGSTQTKMMR